MISKTNLLFGISDIAIIESSQKIEFLLGHELEERESIYRGGNYFRFCGDENECLIIQRNIELDNELAEDDYPDSTTLIYVDSTSRPDYWIKTMTNNEHCIKLLRRKDYFS